MSHSSRHKSAHTDSVFQVGNPACMTIDIPQKSVNITLKQSSRNITDLWKDQFNDCPEVVVCVSGGLDSQFSACLAKQYCSKVQAVTFAYYWNQNLINAYDVSMATRFCQHQEMHHDIIDLDLKKFLNSDLRSVAEKYLTASPQIATHLYAMEQHLIQQNLPVLMGGEVPIVIKSDDTAVLPFRWPSTKKGGIARPNLRHYMSLVLPYSVFADFNNVQLIRDPFMMSDEIYYLAFMHNLAVIEKHKCIFDMEDPLRREVTDYKELYYRSFGYDLLTPLKKRTGFESLKIHLAMETGYYDEFDRRYREILSDVMLRSKSFSRPQFNDVSDHILDETQKLIDTYKLSSCNTYTFDW